jgi:hypothetical protein
VRPAPTIVSIEICWAMLRRFWEVRKRSTVRAKITNITTSTTRVL